MPSGHLERNASVLIIAGSESTATALSGITYLLTKNPEALRQLTEEIRSSFKSEEEIDFVSVNKLTYLLACLDEGLRMYPPVPSGLPRVSPEEGATVSGRYVPKNVRRSPTHISKARQLCRPAAASCSSPDAPCETPSNFAPSLVNCRDSPMGHIPQ